ncbi:MAG: DUF2214 family protein [Gammaproteobacteria bacterium]|nr:DUF2214 family protein [Gammaproteobacteria bacterium]
MDLAIRYFHFLGIIVLFASLSLEHVLAKKSITRETLKRLLIVDIVAGVSAVVVVTCGVSLWWFVGKPAEFYTQNWIFHTKLTVFVCIALISLIPTRYFLSQRKTDSQEIAVPAKVINAIRFELFLFVLMPLLAVLMASGTGLDAEVANHLRQQLVSP